MAGYRRRPGIHVKYTDYQDARYLSARAREDRSRGVSLNLVSSKAGVLTYHAQSLRSPVGYWVVTARKNEGGGGDPGGGDGGGGGTGWMPGMPVAGDACLARYQIYTIWIVSRESANEGAYGEGGPKDYVLVGNGRREIYIDTPPPVYPDGRDGGGYSSTFLASDGRYWDLSFSYYDTGPSRDYDNENGRSTANIYLISRWSVSFTYPDFPTFPSLRNDLYGLEYPVFDASELLPLKPYEASCGLNSYGGAWPPGSGPPPPPPPTNPGAYDFACNCPDQTKKVGALPWANHRSETIARNWTASRAGAQSPCKHMLRAAFLLNQPQLFTRKGIPDQGLGNPYQEWLDNFNYRFNGDAALRIQRRQEDRERSQWYAQRAAKKRAEYNAESERRLVKSLDYYRRQRLKKSRNAKAIVGFGVASSYGPSSVNLLTPKYVSEQLAAGANSSRYRWAARPTGPLQLYGKIFRDLRREGLRTPTDPYDLYYPSK